MVDNKKDTIVILVIMLLTVTFIIGLVIGIALEEQNCEMEKRWLSSCKYNLTHVMTGCTLDEQRQYGR